MVGRLQRLARATLRAVVMLSERSSNASSILLFKVSADVIRNPEAGGNPQAAAGNLDVYVVTVKTGAAELKKNGKTLTILPGMKAEVDIITGKRTVLDYLVRPVTKIADRAFRESRH